MLNLWFTYRQYRHNHNRDHFQRHFESRYSNPSPIPMLTDHEVVYNHQFDSIVDHELESKRMSMW